MPDGSRFGTNVIIYGVDNSFSVHTDNSKKDILIFDKGPTDGLNDTIYWLQKLNTIYFSEQQKKFCLNLHYSESNSFLYVNRNGNLPVQS